MLLMYQLVVAPELPGNSHDRTMSRLLVHLYILQFVVRVNFPEDELLIVEERDLAVRTTARSWG